MKKCIIVGLQQLLDAKKHELSKLKCLQRYKSIFSVPKVTKYTQQAQQAINYTQKFFLDFYLFRFVDSGAPQKTFDQSQYYQQHQTVSVRLT